MKRFDAPVPPAPMCLVIAMWAVAFACSPPGVSMTLDLPSGVTPTWIEVGAFPNSCPSPDEIAGGLPPSGLAARVAYPAGSPVPFGLLDTGKYGFAAVARRDDCGVIAAGCSNANVASARSIDISLSATSSPDASACTEGLVCDNARCVPPSSGDDPNAGAGCSMVLVGAGPLPDALDGGPYVTAPAIAALSNGGFLIAYGEYLDSDGTYRVTTQPIDSGAGALTPNQQVLDGHCANQTSIDAAGLVMGASSGLVVLTRPACSSNPDGGGTQQSGFELLPLDGSGAIVKRNLFLNPTAPPITLSTHALAAAAAPNRYLLAANVSGDATLLSTATANVGAQTTTAFGTPQDTAARVVRTSGALAVEVDGPSVADAGITGAVARVYLTSSATDPASLGAPVDQVSASITALGVLDSRAFLVLNGPGKRRRRFRARLRSRKERHPSRRGIFFAEVVDDFRARRGRRAKSFFCGARRTRLDRNRGHRWRVVFEPGASPTRRSHERHSHSKERAGRAHRDRRNGHDRCNHVGRAQRRAPRRRSHRRLRGLRMPSLKRKSPARAKPK